jgi:hypothetical protein
LLIRVVWFAIEQQYQGTTTTTDSPLAADFYASVERRALRGPRSEPPMYVEVFCHYQNADGLKFWARQGFIDIGPAIGKAELRRMIHYATLAPEPATTPAA